MGGMGLSLPGGVCSGSYFRTKSATMHPADGGPSNERFSTQEAGMILERFKVPAKDQVLVSEAGLRRTVTEIFEKLGLSPDDAAEGADVLTMTDLRGVETHGVSNMLRAYVRDYKAGKLNPRPGWRGGREAPATAVIDAERRLGIMVGPKGRRLAMGKARTPGVGVVTGFNSRHFGEIGRASCRERV